MFFKSLLRFCLLLALRNSLVFSYPQSDWVWGKSGGSSANIPAGSPSSAGSTSFSTGSGGEGSSGIVHGFTSSGTSTNGGGNFASASGTGDNVVITTSHGSGSKPTVIVQVLQPGSTTITGLNAVSTNNNSSSSSPSTRGAVAAGGEARLFLPRVGRFVHNALQNLVSGGVTNNNNNNNGGLFGGGSNFGNGGFLNSILQLGNRIPSSTSSPSSSSSSNNDNEFNTEGNGGGSSSNSGNSGSGGGTGSSFTSLGQNCRCTSADQCRLPSVDKGTCSGGIMCCRSSSTRTVGSSESTGSGSSNTRTPSVRFSPGELRVGLFEEIVRGSGNVVDNAIDFLFAPFLTQEDQQRLATRIGGTRKG